jgi:integrase
MVQSKPGKKSAQLSDGGGLAVLARRTPAGSISRSFVFRGTSNGKQLSPEHLGPYPQMSLAVARKERDRLNGLLKAEGITPQQARKKAEKADKRPRTVKRLFGMYFKKKIDLYRVDDTAEKRQERIRKALGHLDRINNAIGHMLVTDVEPDHLLLEEHVGLEVLLEKSFVSGSELRRLLRAGFRMAISLKWIKRDDNPASDEVFEDLLTERFHISEPRAAIDYIDLPGFVAAVKAYKNKGRGMADRPLATVPPLLFLIYTGVRTKEVRYAKWGQINWEKKLWEVPPENLKAGRATRAIPISQAVQSLE